jgi:hypothetical protein
VTGRGERLAVCLFAMYALHWLCLRDDAARARSHRLAFPPGA